VEGRGTSDGIAGMVGLLAGGRMHGHDHNGRRSRGGCWMLDSLEGWRDQDNLSNLFLPLPPQTEIQLIGEALDTGIYFGLEWIIMKLRLFEESPPHSIWSCEKESILNKDE